jgi:5-methylcytosine-specific restriction endonuclease McrA
VTSPIAVGERIISLLDEAVFTATYKYGVLLGLLDLCLEMGAEVGAGALTITTRQLAGKVLAVYWPQVRPFPLLEGNVPRQNSRGSRDARIVRVIDDYKQGKQTGWFSPVEAKLKDPGGYDRLLREIELVLIEMPLPRLQCIGRESEQFLYQINWTVEINKGELRRYIRGDTSSFDNRIILRPGVASALIQLNGLLRPLIQRSWALKVADLNGLGEGVIQDFLFGQERSDLARVRSPLNELQLGRCFYCALKLDAKSHVDHFLPWSRVLNNNLENLVLAHVRCNSDKKDFLPAMKHVKRWGRRMESGGREHQELASIAAKLTWPSDPPATLGTARAIYSRLPDTAKLWVFRKEFEDRGSEALVL